MYRNILASVAAVVLVVTVFGCAPRVRVKKNPTARDQGIRYYRPKPYLLVSPAGETTTSGDKAVTKPTDRYVSLELKYLPDFGEEYSINVCPGLGSANVSVSLEDGWNLTSINQELDTQFDENLGAVASLVGAVAPKGLVGTSGDAGGANAEARMTVAARNIPLGFYEAVVGVDHRCGKKQLFGWRYVGFAPFNACPLYASGADCVSCNDGSLAGVLYGLTFYNGVMTFRPLDSMHQLSTEEATGTLPKPPTQSLGVARTAKIQADIGASVDVPGPFHGTFIVRVDPSSTATSIRVNINYPRNHPSLVASVKDNATNAIRKLYEKAAIFVDVKKELPEILLPPRADPPSSDVEPVSDQGVGVIPSPNPNFQPSSDF